MKLVKPLEILGNPNRVDRQHACPDCSARSVVFEDGSIICVPENKCFAPESTDGELFAMRKDFDARNGITPSDRLLIPARVMHGQGLPNCS